jgi:glycosyltransferase involved in cell wall biosynthesis
VGGLATTVKDGVSGIVLPKNSPSYAYVDEIIKLFGDPARYYELCRTSRERYEKELNWDVVGSQLVKILQKVINEDHSAVKSPS